ncbi:contact-dependent growth inhibition system immunity protein [Lelliottia sp. V106_10]|uniref:Contact-dependent growth inhibition system immunity protein n=1 Tax=Lelliottia wanjuensis TaxID=3050585 RepID=A0AAP4D9S5_9ENTR|nr:MULTISPECIES: contact-dependent growth inhibition system immunity protein [unclassified Lelliottia]MDK9355137.1 contact-dependent growth inhibition system immunity protein [Lelliottia sp. V106_16]MDK9365008.1 contact-dependent growth inhibition system immunity protein [Lelliottia sp. V106_12]MDK9371804.1 contact-dependent growth inhibition system immunity protein [Lelliottia sp. V106_10]MDK9598982.1 contact-dependent growth inhibition system immunity protein [Lelliottia sp. V106_5]MDK961880
MITFRKLIGNINVRKEPDQQSPLELWFERIIDVPIEELMVEDLCRAIRQKLCIDQLMPRVLEVLTEEPLAGEYYDGELIAALSTIKENDLKDQKSTFIKIKQLLNQLASSDISDDLKKDILKINQISV